MSRKKLIKKLKELNPKLNQLELNTIIDTFSESVSEALKQGHNVEIRGFGKWHTKRLKENYNSRNPLNNELIYKPERIKVRFKAYKKLNKIINK